MYERNLPCSISRKISLALNKNLWTLEITENHWSKFDWVTLASHSLSPTHLTGILLLGKQEDEVFSMFAVLRCM